METYQSEKLVRYEMNNQEVMVGFAKFKDAQNYADKNGGKLVEIGFKDGNDNPQITEEAGLIEKKLHYFVEAGPEYQFIHSSDPGFRKYADELQKIDSNEIKEYSPEEKYMSNGEREIAEDPIIVLKNKEFQSVTSRERSKYLKQANVYEIGVIKNL